MEDFSILHSRLEEPEKLFKRPPAARLKEPQKLIRLCIVVLKKDLTKHGPLEEGTTSHSSILASRISWTVWKGNKIWHLRPRTHSNFMSNSTLESIAINSSSSPPGLGQFSRVGAHCVFLTTFAQQRNKAILFFNGKYINVGVSLVA